MSALRNSTVAEPAVLLLISIAVLMIASLTLAAFIWRHVDMRNDKKKPQERFAYGRP